MRLDASLPSFLARRGLSDLRSRQLAAYQPGYRGVQDSTSSASVVTRPDDGVEPLAVHN
jgi:hypothetical protein